MVFFSVFFRSHACLRFEDFDKACTRRFGSFGSNNICGPNLIRIRHEKGLSQRQLAKNLQIAGYDVDHHFIRRIENGERFVTDMELVALAKVLQVEITDLLDLTIPVAVQKDSL